MSNSEIKSDSEVEFHDSDVTLRHIALEGEIENHGEISRINENVSTLDEPVRDTVMRDLKAVGQKFFHVLYPKQSTILLKEWDLWGPLVLCTLMGILLQDNTSTRSSFGTGSGPQFAEVVFIFWAGASIVTINIKLLGGDISFFQSVCVLGYCVLPLGLCLILCRVILLVHQSSVLFVVRFLLVILAFVWSTFASTAFLASRQLVQRKALAVYPIFLFYSVISWLIISHTHA